MATENARFLVDPKSLAGTCDFLLSSFRVAVDEVRRCTEETLVRTVSRGDAILAVSKCAFALKSVAEVFVEVEHDMRRLWNLPLPVAQGSADDSRAKEMAMNLCGVNPSGDGDDDDDEPSRLVIAESDDEGGVPGTASRVVEPDSSTFKLSSQGPEITRSEIVTTHPVMANMLHGAMSHHPYSGASVDVSPRRAADASYSCSLSGSGWSGHHPNMVHGSPLPATVAPRGEFTPPCLPMGGSSSMPSSVVVTPPPARRGRPPNGTKREVVKRKRRAPSNVEAPSALPGAAASSRKVDLSFLKPWLQQQQSALDYRKFTGPTVHHPPTPQQPEMQSTRDQENDSTNWQGVAASASWQRIRAYGGGGHCSSGQSLSATVTSVSQNTIAPTCSQQATVDSAAWNQMPRTWGSQSGCDQSQSGWEQTASLGMVQSTTCRESGGDFNPSPFSEFNSLASCEGKSQSGFSPTLQGFPSNPPSSDYHDGNGWTDSSNSHMPQPSCSSATDAWVQHQQIGDMTYWQQYKRERHGYHCYPASSMVLDSRYDHVSNASSASPQVPATWRLN